MKLFRLFHRPTRIDSPRERHERVIHALTHAIATLNDKLSRVDIEMRALASFCQTHDSCALRYAKLCVERYDISQLIADKQADITRIETKLASLP